MISKRIKKMTRDQQMAAVAQMAFTVTSLTSDRHPCNLARVAQDLCTKDPVDDPEQGWLRRQRRSLCGFL